MRRGTRTVFRERAVVVEFVSVQQEAGPVLEKPAVDVSVVRHFAQMASLIGDEQTSAPGNFLEVGILA